jgi:hypothetical protein
MCDEESSGLQNLVRLHPIREPKILLERAEYTFPAMKNDLVSVFVFVHVEQITINMYFQKIIFGNYSH